MNEAEWNASTDPQAMLDACQMGTLDRGGDKGWQFGHEISGRKLRLLAVAVARHGGCGSWADVGHLLRAAERMAEGEPHGLSEADLLDAGQYVASWLVAHDAETTARRIFDHYEPDVEDRESGAAQAALLRDICGNPFRPVALPEEVTRCGRCGSTDCDHFNEEESCLCADCRSGDWVTDRGWLTPQVCTLAEIAYDLRMDDGTLDPLTLMAVADALEEAGCPSEVLEPVTAQAGSTVARSRQPQTSVAVPHPILAHLRSPGPHVRGCWALDAVLGKG